MDILKRCTTSKSDKKEETEEMENLHVEQQYRLFRGPDSISVNLAGAASLGGSETESWRSAMFELMRQTGSKGKDSVDKAFNILDKNIKSKKDLFDGWSGNCTILHLACNHDNEIIATESVNRILDIAKGFDYKCTEIQEFVNHCTNEGRTALHIAISNGYKDVVEKLIENAADVNIREPGTKYDPIYYIYLNFPQIMLSRFEKGIIITEGHADTTVECDFSSITGIKIDDDKNGKYNELRETRLLSMIIGNSKLQRSYILLHPLVQTFLHKKGSFCIDLIIWISILYQFGWCLLSVIFLVHQSHFFKNIPGNIWNISEGETNTSSGNTQFPETGEPFVSIFYCCYVISLCLELVEVTSSPTRHFYWGQHINYIQIALLTILPFAGVGISPPFVNAFGIFAALLVLQSQATKFSWAGIYNQMLFQIFCNFLKFFLAFTPMLLAFMLTFHYLFYPSPEFALESGMGVVKLFAMLIGELEHTDIFFPENESETLPLPILTILVFIIFVIVVVILLQNLLTGLTVLDVEILKDKCMADHLTTRLEAICMIEHLLTYSCLLWILPDKIKSWVLRCILVGPALENVTPEDQQCGHPYTTNLSNLPETVRNAIKGKYMLEMDPHILHNMKIALTQFRLELENDKETDS